MTFAFASYDRVQCHIQCYLERACCNRADSIWKIAQSKKSKDLERDMLKTQVSKPNKCIAARIHQ